MIGGVAIRCGVEEIEHAVVVELLRLHACPAQRPDDIRVLTRRRDVGDPLAIGERYRIGYRDERFRTFASHGLEGGIEVLNADVVAELGIRRPAIDAVATSAPPPRARKAGTAARVPNTTPPMLAAITRS